MGTRCLVVLLVAVTAVSGPQSGYAASVQRDQGQIVFSSQHAGESEIWVMNADGTNKHNLTRHDGAKFGDLEPSWSPDGRQIAFVSGPALSPKDRQIWVMNADGSDAHQLTSGPGFSRSPSWTADGNAMVFQATDAAGNVEIYRVNADGTALTDLTNDPAVDRAPATSPHGKKIVFSSERGGGGHLYVLNEDGALQQITNGPGYDIFANWSPRGNEIVFSRDERTSATGTQVDLYIVHADGTGERRLTDTPGVIEYFPAFSPDGRQLTYSWCVLASPVGLRCRIHTTNLDGTGDVDLGFPDLHVSFPIVDSFDENTRNVDLWSLFHAGTGGFVQWANGRLEMSIAADGIPATAEGLGAHVGANCRLNGDFDAQVDYELLTWPAGDGISVGITTFFASGAFSNGVTERSTNPFGETYNSFIGNRAVRTTDQAGSLRLVRSGSTIASYYKSAGSWVELASGPAQQAPTVVALWFESFGGTFYPFGHQAAKVALDNFRLDATDVDCSALGQDFHPDWRPVIRRPDADDERG